VALQRSQPRAGLLVLVAPAAWGVARVVRVAWVVRHADPAAHVDWVARPAAPAVLVGLAEALPAAAIPAQVVSAATHVAVLGLLVVGQVAIDRVAIDPALAVRGQALVHRVRVVRRQAPLARQAAASVVRSALASVSRIVRQAGPGRVVQGPGVLGPPSRRPTGLTNPIVPAMARTVGLPDAGLGGRTSCHRLSLGH
jgi:hypothetical protein